jgi:methanogenic corrinoid protein MtbC1
MAELRRQRCNGEDALQVHERPSDGEGEPGGEDEDTGRGAYRDEGPDMQAQLSRTIESEIIPRLLLTHRGELELRRCAAKAAPAPDPEQVSNFSRLLLLPDASSAYFLLESELAKGVPLETLMLELLAPAARRLGEFWEADLCDFAQVTLGLSRLHGLLRTLQPTMPLCDDGIDPTRRILLVPSPGEQHTFGIVVVEEFFRRAGWDVAGGFGTVGTDVSDLVRREAFGIVGFSLGCETRLESLALLIRRVRQASRNRDVFIMVGGPVFVRRPELAMLVGADTTAADGRTAVELADELLGRADLPRSRC